MSDDPWGGSASHDPRGGPVSDAGMGGSSGSRDRREGTCEIRSHEPRGDSMPARPLFLLALLGCVGHG
jgi:hypothetical protein